jgi:hypothetical protein
MGRVSKHVDDGVRPQSTLRGCVDRCAMVARLKAVPAKLRLIATLDPDPTSLHGQFATIGLDFRRARETIASTDDFRHAELQHTEIDIARMGTADQNESCEPDPVLTREC